MTQNTNPSGGLMMYCFKHDYGFLLLGYQVPQCIWKGCFSDKPKTASCYWEDVGTFKIQNGKDIVLHPSDENWSRDLVSGYSYKHFVKNIYNESMEEIELPIKNPL